jgi:Predicted membrane protein
LILSPVNVVVHERIAKIAVPSVDVVYVLGIPYYVPTVRVVENKSRVAVNLGGAVVPVTLSLWLLAVVTNRGALPEALIVLSVTSIVSYFASRAVPGVGVVMSPVVPPLVSIVVSLVVLGRGSSRVDLQACKLGTGRRFTTS